MPESVLNSDFRHMTKLFSVFAELADLVTDLAELVPDLVPLVPGPLNGHQTVFRVFGSTHRTDRSGNRSGGARSRLCARVPEPPMDA